MTVLLTVFGLGAVHQDVSLLSLKGLSKHWQETKQDVVLWWSSEGSFFSLASKFCCGLS